MDELFENSMDRLQDQVGEWADATFTTSTIHSAAAHLLSEAVELYMSCGGSVSKAGDILQAAVKKGHDSALIPGELADVEMLAFHIAHKGRISLHDETLKKLAINRQRSWLATNVHGFREHDKGSGIRPENDPRSNRYVAPRIILDMENERTMSPVGEVGNPDPDEGTLDALLYDAMRRDHRGSYQVGVDVAKPGSEVTVERKFVPQLPGLPDLPTVGPKEFSLIREFERMQPANRKLADLIARAQVQLMDIVRTHGYDVATKVLDDALARARGTQEAGQEDAQS